MPQSLIDLAFGQATLNDPEMVLKFGTTRKDRFAQDLFLQKGRDHSDRVERNVAQWKEVTLSREPAPLTGKRSPAVVLEGVGQDLKTCVLADIRVASEPIPLDEITSEQAAMNWLAIEGQNYRRRMLISRELMAWGQLKGGFTSATIPNSKVTFTLTQAVTALSPAASWATPTTKIVSAELDAYRGTYEDACGLELEQLVVDNLVHRYVRQNTEVRSFYAANPNPDKRGTPEAPGLFAEMPGASAKSYELDGLRVDVHRSKYSSSGALTKYLGDKRVIALPGDDALPMVLGFAEGYGSIPTNAIGFDANLGTQAPNRGEYSYAYLTPDPAAVVVVYGWRGLFFLTFPEAVGYDDDVTTP